MSYVFITQHIQLCMLSSMSLLPVLGSASKGSASFYRIHNIFHGSGSISISISKPLASPLTPPLTLKISPLLPHPSSPTPHTSLTPPPSPLLWEFAGKTNVSRSKKQIKCMKDIRMHRQSNYLFAKECIEKEERVYV